MSERRVIVGQSEWAFPAGDVTATVESIKTALETGAVVALDLVDGSGREVTVYLNGKAAQTVVVDLGGGPRPSEISG
ncbi:MAG TPA: VCBS domain-containing protein [Actinocrinis sp.]|nr:VCBS domain-containing protein [Actinocrinis sp.]